MCPPCGGTGDMWDDENGWWATPTQKCPTCGGWGEIDGDDE